MKKYNLLVIPKSLNILIFVLLFSFQSFSQMADKWIFGESAMIDFSSGQAVALQTADTILFPNGCSAISDEDGNLLLFSDGMSVFNSQFDTIPNGNDLAGNNFASQSSIIIPQPGYDSRFYIFSVDMYISPVFTDGINYSIVDVNPFGGAVMVSKNNLLLRENAQKISAVQHTNGVDYWIVVHGFGDEKGGNFYSYLLTESNLDTVPIVTTIGHPHNGNSNLNNGAGSMKISPDGSKLALVIPDDGIVELYDFNASVGMVNNLKTSEIGQFPYANGIEFSPDNSKLYFTITPLGDGINFLYQLNLNQDDPFSNPFIVHQFDVETVTNADSLFGALQLAPDGKIYVAKFRIEIISKENLGVIYNPNRLGNNCNYNVSGGSVDNGLSLNGGGSLIGLPNFVSSFLESSGITVKGNSVLDTTKFFVRNTANIDSVAWVFEGEAEVLEGQSLSPCVIYKQTGEYNVNLTTYFNGEAYYYSTSVTIELSSLFEHDSFSIDALVYPNPSNGRFEIKLSNYVGGIDIMIYNISGKLVFNESDIFVEGTPFFYAVDFASSPNGIYILKVVNKTGEYFSKIIINQGN